MEPGLAGELSLQTLSFAKLLCYAHTSLHRILISDPDTTQSTCTVAQQLQPLEKELAQLTQLFEPVFQARVVPTPPDLAILLLQSELVRDATQRMSIFVEEFHEVQHLPVAFDAWLPAVELICVAAVELRRHASTCSHTHRSYPIRGQQRTAATLAQTSDQNKMSNKTMPTYKPCQNNKKREHLHAFTGSMHRYGASQSQPRRLQSSRTSRRMHVIRHICWEGPAKILNHWKHRASSLLSSSAGAMVEIGQLVRCWRSHRQLDMCMPYVTMASCQEFVDCAGWVLGQDPSGQGVSNQLQSKTVPLASDCHACGNECLGSQKSTKNKQFLLQRFLPREAAYQHFAKRGVFCFLWSFRTLTATELFEAAITKVLDSDIDWPFPDDDLSDNVRRFMSLCNTFLGTDTNGEVRLRSRCVADFFKDNPPIPARDGHLLMALICLMQFKRQPRLIIRPWLDFHSCQTTKDEFPLHAYTVTYWCFHYREAQGRTPDLAENLHFAIQAAWSAERAAISLQDVTHGFSELDMTTHIEALAVGLELCQAYGIRDLEETYKRMGAEHNQKCDCTTYRPGQERGMFTTAILPEALDDERPESAVQSFYAKDSYKVEFRVLNQVSSGMTWKDKIHSSFLDSASSSESVTSSSRADSDRWSSECETDSVRPELLDPEGERWLLV